MSQTSPTNPSLVKISEAAKALGIHKDTLRRWEKAGKIQVVKDNQGNRFYNVGELKKLFTKPLTNHTNPIKPIVAIKAATPSVVKIAEAAKLLNVHKDTLRRWEKAGKIQVAHKKSGARLYKIDHLKHLATNINPPPTTEELLKSGLSSHETTPSPFIPQLSAQNQPLPIHQTSSKYSIRSFFVFGGILSFIYLIALVVIFSFKQPLQEVINIQHQTESKQVLAATASDPTVKINANLKLSKSLTVADSINGLQITASDSGIVFTDPATQRKLTITGTDITLDQSFTSNNTPTIDGLNLTADKNQLVLGPLNGIQGTLTWTPTSSDKTITLPNATTTLIGTDTTDTLKNKTIKSGDSNTISGSFPDITGITSLGTVSTGTWNGTKIGTGYGGTGLTTYTTGDLLYASASNTLAKLTVGSSGQVLSVSSGTPAWTTLGASGITADSLDFTELADSMTLDANLAISASSSNYSINFDSNTLYLDTANNRIGIGTSSPVQTFQVNNSTSSPFVVTSSGNVGIGFTSPTANLHIVGTAIIAPTADNATPLTLRATSGSGTPNIFDVTNSSGSTSYLTVTSTGSLTLGGNTITASGDLAAGGKIQLTDIDNAVVGTAIEGGWTLNSNTFTYRRPITVTNNDSSQTLPANHEITVTLSGTTASQIYTNTQTDGDDFRIGYYDGSTYTEITRNLTTYTSSSIVFTFQLQASIAAQAATSNYFVYYKNSSLTCSSCTYTGNTQLDSADDASSWTSADSGFVTSQETSSPTPQEGTGSIEAIALVDKMGSFSTSSQGQLSTGLKDKSVVTTTINGTDYVYAIGGNNGSADVSTVYKSTISSANIGALSTTSQGQLPQVLSKQAATIIPDSYTYKRTITIDNTSNATTHTNYQVSVTLDTASLITAGKMQSDCDDIRFRDADDSTEISNYWVENCNNASTKIWVKVPSVAASSSKSIFLYYGNTLATARSSAANTFIRAITGVQGAWTMDEASGNVSDSSGNSNTGTPTGTTVVSGQFSNARDLTGAGDVITITENGTLDITGDMTISMWIKPSSTHAAYVDILRKENSEDGFGLETDGNANGNSYYFGWKSGGSACWGANAFTLTANSWQHLVIVKNGTSRTTYINNVSQGTCTGAASTITANNASLQIGNYNGARDWNGQIDELRIYNQVLSTAEISDLYSNYGYTTSNNANTELVRKFSSPEPSASAGAEGDANSATFNDSYSLFVFGGINGSTAQTTVYKAAIDSSGDAGTLSTTSQGQLPQTLYDHTVNSVTISGTSYAYALGGNNGTTDQTTVYKSTVSNGNLGSFSTTSQGQLPQALSAHASTTIAISGTNYIYVLGGKNGSTAQTTVYKATIDSSGNIGSFSTTSQGQLPVALYDLQAVTTAVGSVNYIFVFGGHNGTSPVSTVYRATIDSSGNIGTFSAVAHTALSQNLFGHSVITKTISSTPYFYTFGGSDGTSAQTTVYKSTLDSTMTSYSVSKTISSVDLSNKNSLALKYYSSRTGSNIMEVAFSEDGSTWQTNNFSVSSASTWETKTWDISGIAAASRNAVTRLRIKVTTSATTQFTDYFDDIRVSTSTFTGTDPTSSGGSAVLGAANLDINAQGTGMVRINYDATNALAGTGGLSVFNGGSASLLTINSSGNIGIGNTNPTTSLFVNGNAMIGYTAGSAASLTNGLAVSGNLGVGTSNPGSKLTVIGNIGIGTSATGAALQVNGAGLFGWGTASSAAPANGLAIRGNVGIGTSSPTAPLEVRGSGTGATVAKFTDENATGCTLATGGTISCSSDINLKKNITDINYGLNELMQLHPVTFNWNSDNDLATKSLGFIAQEIEQILPNLIKTDLQTGLKELNSIGLIPVLAKSIQQQQLQINNLTMQQAKVLSATVSAQTATSSAITYNLQPTTLNLTPPDILLATSSAILANITVTSDATISGRLVGYDLSVQNSLKSLGKTTLADTTIAGNLTVNGTLSIENGNQINVLGTLFLQNSPFATGIDIFNGKATIDNLGNLTVTSVRTDKLILDNQVLGESKILAGDTETTIQTSALTNKSKIFITAQSEIDTPLFILDKINGESFKVKVKNPYPYDIIFDWQVLDSP